MKTIKNASQGITRSIYVNFCYSYTAESSSSKSQLPQFNQTNKIPPPSTLVRRSGSNLAGNKPTYIPKDVVEANQNQRRQFKLVKNADIW